MGNTLLFGLRDQYLKFQSSNDYNDINQLMNLFLDVDSITIGINECTDPQISEHCPKNRPGYLIKNDVWLIRPGLASTLIPKAGIAQECRTSAAVTKIRV